MTYSASLAAQTKAPIYMVHFTVPDKRFINRDWSGRTSTADLGLVTQGRYQISLEQDEAGFRVGEFSPALIDLDGGVTSWLETNEAQLANRPVDVYWGFEDIDEAEMLKTTFFFRDYRAARLEGSGNDAGAFEIILSDILAMAESSVGEDLADNPDFSLQADVVDGATTIQLEKDPTGVWPATGHAMLYDSDTNECEIVAYSSITAGEPATVNVSTRRFAPGDFSGFASKTWRAQNTRVKRLHSMSGHPLDLMRQLLLTTDSGTNGSYDLGDGRGLGDIIPDSLIDHAGFDAAKQNVQQTWWLLLDEPITNLKRYIAKQLLLPAGYFQTVNSAGQLTARRQFTPLASSTDLTGDVFVMPTGWRRNYEERKNSVAWQLDKFPGDRQYKSSITVEQADSVTAYKKSKAVELKIDGARGPAGVPFGIPDLGGQEAVNVAANVFLLEYSNPRPTFEVQLPWEHKDIVVGDAVTLTHPTVRTVGRSTRGSTQAEIFVVTKKTINTDTTRRGGRVELELSQRLAPFERQFFVNTTGIGGYAGATEAQKRKAFISPNSGNFADGGEPYRWLSGAATDGVIEGCFPWFLNRRQDGEPGFFDTLHGICRERDRFNAEWFWEWRLSKTDSVLSSIWNDIFTEHFYFPIWADAVEIEGTYDLDDISGTTLKARYEIGSGNFTDESPEIFSTDGVVSYTWSADLSGAGLEGSRVSVTSQAFPSRNASVTLVGTRIRFYRAQVN